MQLYQLAEELSLPPKTLRDWLKSKGLGGKNQISPKAVAQARAHFVRREGVMAEAVAEPKPAPVEHTSVTPQLRIQRARRIDWGKSEPVGPSVDQMSTEEQRDLFKAMRQGTKKSTSQTLTSQTLTSQTLTSQTPTSKPTSSTPAEGTSPQPSPRAPSQTAPQAPPTAQTSSATPELSFSEQYYKKRYDELYAQYTSQRERLKQRDLAYKELVGEHEALKRQRPMERAPEPVSEPSEEGLVWEELSSFGLNERDASNVMLELMEHPVRGRELLYRLKIDAPQELLQGFTFFCGDERCEDLARPNAKLGLLLVEREQCAVCGGNDGQRAYRALLKRVRQVGVTRLLLVGGEDANTSTLKQLAKSCPGLTWSFIDGGGRDDQTSANRRVEGAGGVLLWGGMKLPHKLSGLYKTAADRLKVPCATIPPGQRGVSAICQTALVMLGGDPEEEA